MKLLPRYGLFRHPALHSCRACRHHYALDGFGSACPACGTKCFELAKAEPARKSRVPREELQAFSARGGAALAMTDEEI